MDFFVAFVYVLGTLITWPLLYRWSYNDYKRSGLPWDDSTRNFHIGWSLFMSGLWFVVMPLAAVYYLVTRGLGPMFRKLEK